MDEENIKKKYRELINEYNAYVSETRRLVNRANDIDSKIKIMKNNLLLTEGKLLSYEEILGLDRKDREKYASGTTDNKDVVDNALVDTPEKEEKEKKEET